MKTWFRLHDDADNPNWGKEQPRDRMTLFWYRYLGKEPWYTWRSWMLMELMNPFWWIMAVIGYCGVVVLNGF
jgi:hypothetical protein